MLPAQILYFHFNSLLYFLTSQTHQLLYQTNVFLTNYFTRRFLGSSSLIDFVAGPGLTLSFFTRGDGFGRSSENIHNTLQSLPLSD